MGSPTYWQELVLEYPGSQHMLDRSVPHRLKFRSGVEGRNTAKFGLLISIIILGYTMSKPTLFGIYMRGRDNQYHSLIETNLIQYIYWR